MEGTGIERFDLRESISKIGFWFKIPSSPKGFAGTRAAEPSFPAERDFPPDQILFVGRKPEAYCCMSRILNAAPIPPKGGRAKDIFEMGSNKKQSGYYRFAFLLTF